MNIEIPIYRGQNSQAPEYHPLREDRGREPTGIPENEPYLTRTEHLPQNFTFEKMLDLLTNGFEEQRPIEHGEEIENWKAANWTTHPAKAAHSAAIGQEYNQNYIFLVADLEETVDNSTVYRHKDYRPNEYHINNMPPENFKAIVAPEPRKPAVKHRFQDILEEPEEQVHGLNLEGGREKGILQLTEFVNEEIRNL